jgi:hypothetical protein
MHLRASLAAAKIMRNSEKINGVGNALKDLSVFRRPSRFPKPGRSEGCQYLSVFKRPSRFPKPGRSGRCQDLSVFQKTFQIPKTWKV